MICIYNNKIMFACVSLSVLCGYGVGYCYDKIKKKYYNKKNNDSDIENQKKSVSDNNDVTNKVPDKLL